MMSSNMPKSERDLIELIEASVQERGEGVVRGIGDDAAVLAGDGVAVVSTDSFVDGVHFTRKSFPYEAIGHKALAAAISDLAAMGAGAGHCLVALGLPASVTEDDVEEIYRGMERVASVSSATVCGGDLCRSDQFFITVTAIGWARPKDEIIGRDGAGVGDLVAVTGELGGAGAGLVILEGASPGLDEGPRLALVERQLRPWPKIKEGQALGGAGVSAMIDISDGLAGDADRIARASNAWLEIDLSMLPIQAGVEQVASRVGREPYELAATAGEDYELLATVPAELKGQAEEAVSSAGGVLTWIGSVVDAPKAGVALKGPDGRPQHLKGYDHFAK